MLSIHEIVESIKYKYFIRNFRFLSWIVTIISGIVYFNSEGYDNIIITTAGGMWVGYFFLIGFRPLQEHLDWSLVYPELAFNKETDILKQQIAKLNIELSLLQSKSYEASYNSVPEIVESMGFRMLSKFLFKLAFSIIIIGGIFIFNSWAYGNLIASIGGVTLAFLYFFRGFASLYEVLDWTLVYPELSFLSDNPHIKPIAHQKREYKWQIADFRREINLLKNKNK